MKPEIKLPNPFDKQTDFVFYIINILFSLLGIMICVFVLDNILNANRPDYIVGILFTVLWWIFRLPPLSEIKSKDKA